MLTGRVRDRGSAMVVVLLVMLILAGLVAAMTSRSLNALRVGERDREGAAAVAGAELAVAEASALIEQGAVDAFSGTVAVADGTASYEAAPRDGDNWQIYAEAMVRGTARALLVDLGREARYPFALFTATSLYLHDNTGSVDGRVGTNGVFDVSGASLGSVQELYRPSGSCTKCDTPVERDGPYPLIDPEIPDKTQPCPKDGRFDGEIDGQAGVPFVCNDVAVPVTFGRVSIVNGPLVIIVGPEVNASFNGAVVNTSASPEANPAVAEPAASVDPGPADQFLFFKLEAEDRPLGGLDLDGASISGLIAAPHSAVKLTNLALTGSLVLDSLVVADGGYLALTYGSELAAFASAGWGITNWRQISPR